MVEKLSGDTTQCNVMSVFSKGGMTHQPTSVWFISVVMRLSEGKDDTAYPKGTTTATLHVQR